MPNGRLIIKTRHSDNKGGVTLDHTLPTSVMGKLRRIASIHSKELVKDSGEVKTYHGRSLASIICDYCGYQHTKQVVDGNCLNQKACEKRQKAWK